MVDSKASGCKVILHEINQPMPECEIRLGFVLLNVYEIKLRASIFLDVINFSEKLPNCMDVGSPLFDVLVEVGEGQEGSNVFKK